MRGVVQGLDGSVVIAVVFLEGRDASAGGAEGGVARGLQGEAKPGADQEGQRCAVGDDDLVRAVAGEDLVEGTVGPAGQVTAGFGAGDAFVVVEALAFGRREDEALVEPLLGSAAGLTVGLFAEVAIR